MPRRVEICPCCGRKIVDYRHSLSQLLVGDLEMLYKVGGIAKLSEVDEVFELTHSQLANFQKLRYFGLVTKEGHVYHITDAGVDFLIDDGTAPAYVITRDSVVISSGPLVTRCEITEMVQNRDDFEAQA